jgi:hypothetical protein
MEMNPDVRFHLSSLSRMIYFVTDEEDRFLLKLQNTLKAFAPNTHVFNAALGLLPLEGLIRDWSTRSHTENLQCSNIHDALIKVYKDDPKGERNFYVFTDPERWLSDPHVVRRLLNIVHQLHNDICNIKVLIFVGTRRFIPEKLQRYMEVINDKGLTSGEIEELVLTACDNLHTSPPKNMSQMFRGLTSYEVIASIGQSVIKTKKDPVNPKSIDPAYIADFRRRQIMKTDLVQYIDTKKFGFDSVGGAARFKAWAYKTRWAWSAKGQEFGLKPPKGILAVGVWGCLAEGTRIDYRRGTRVSSRGRSLPIEALFEKFNGIKGSAHPSPPWIPGMPTYLQSWDANLGHIVYNEMLGIADSGLQDCIRITTDAGMLELTGNHPVLMGNGTFRPAEEIQPGDTLRVRGSMKLGSTFKEMRGLRKRVIVEGLKFHPIAWKKFVTEPSTGVQYEYGRTTKARLVFEARMNHLPYEEYIRILKESPEVAETLEFIPPEYDVHHIDEDTLNDDIGNLMLLTHVKHAQLHQESAPIHNQREFTKESVVLSVKPIGQRRTFDIEMRLPHANFVTSEGFIAHNCGKSLSVKAMGHAWNLPVIQLEMGRLRSSGVGESEANVYKAIRIIEAAAPCVTGETEVRLEDGTSKTIEDLWKSPPKNLNVACWNEKTLMVAVTRVSEITRRESEAFAVLADKGYSLNATANHLHWVQNDTLGAPCAGQWRRTDALSVGDSLFSIDEGWVKIQSVESIGVQPVYDLVCEGEHTHSFIANGLVTHNCLVWVDEAEKSLSGGQSSAQSDAGTTSRTIGILSTWLQETEAQVCLALTANSLKTLPIEFINRMDERFFFDVPSEEDRVEILKIHIKKAGQDSDRFNLADLAEKAKGMVGREIEQAIGAAMIESFASDKVNLDEAVLSDELIKKPRIIKTMVDEVKEITDWIGWSDEANDGIRARYASNPTQGTAIKLVGGND